LRFTTIAASSGHTCALNGSGAAYCWGWNLEGQLGIGSTTNHQPTPVAVSGGLTFSALAVGDYHTCALTTSGAAYCWGANFRGQLGDGSTTNRSAPVAVSGGLSFSSLAAGEFHTCALTSSGSAYCWGENAVGQLGDSSTTRRSSPVAVAGGLSFRALAAGSGLESRAHTCALTSSGAAYCWGGNDAGELGDGVTKSEICERNSDSFRCSRTPVAVAGGLTFSALTVGGFHTCGLTTAGAAYCWGANGWGQLGTDSTTGSSIPVAVSGGLIFGASAPYLKSAGSGGTAIRP
jgi:alpha-tubulin suppressor-like RCC1 family protein